MKFKDYLRDQLIYIIIYIVSIFLVVGIMMLDLIIRNENLNLENVFYALFLAVIGLSFIIWIDFMKKKKFYTPLSNGLSEDNSMEYIFNTPENISNEFKLIHEILKRNYHMYMATLEKQRKTLKSQMDFNNRWIHQMKTPISVIKLMIENQMNQETETDLNTKMNYDSLEEELEKLTHGLEMALYTLRINDFELDMKVENIAVLDIIREVINDNKSTFIVNSIYPKVISNEDLVVKSDKKWLKFILSQILTNSIKYSKVKDIENKDITFEVMQEQDRTIISIKDKGVGIPRGDLQRVFDPFFTGSNGRRFTESTGMGLYLSKDAAQRLGHEIEIESTESEGTTVNIIFYHGKSIYHLEKA